MRKFRLPRLPFLSDRIWENLVTFYQIHLFWQDPVFEVATLAMLLKGLVTSSRPHCCWLCCANIATSISGSGKHSCATVLLNNIYFFGSSLACCRLFWQLPHTSAVCQSHSHLQCGRPAHMCGAQQHMCCHTSLHQLPLLTLVPVSTRDWTNNPILRPHTTLSFGLNLFLPHDNRKVGRWQG